jgi:hypothetical protein
MSQNAEPTLLEFESNKQCQDMLRFLIDDQAFSTDFLMTAIAEYFQNNKKTTIDNRCDKECKDRATL